MREDVATKLARVARRRVLWLGVAAAAAVLLYLPFWRKEHPAEGPRDLRVLAADAYTERSVPRLAALRQAMSGRLVPRPDLGTCAVDPATLRRWSPVHLDAFDPMKGNAFVDGVPAIDLDVELAVWRTKVASWDRELDVVSEGVLREHRAHEGLPDDRRATTRAYLYDYRLQRIVCAGDVGALVADAGRALPARRPRDASAPAPAPRGDELVLHVAGPPRP